MVTLYPDAGTGAKLYFHPAAGCWSGTGCLSWLTLNQDPAVNPGKVIAWNKPTAGDCLTLSFHPAPDY